MIPIKLSVQGLYSYQKLQEIDFRQLVGSNVFGIFGKVGSGKTSLLEAISFALYGETERLNSRDNRQYNMMNLKSKHLIIDFEFQAGSEGQLYRFVYEAKRNSKKHAEISSTDRRMFIWTNDTWQPIGNDKDDVAVLSKEILGLDYDNFKRTIIIPQNQFREFLELSPTDRTKMMNQLFKLDQYNLAERVTKLSKVNDEQLSELRGLLAPLDAVTPDAIEGAKSEIGDVLSAIKAKELAIGQLEPEEARLLFLKKQHQQFETAQKELAKWLQDEAIYQKKQQTVAEFERCQLMFQNDLENLKKQRTKQLGLERALTDAQKKLVMVSATLPELVLAHENAKAAYESRELLLQQRNELDTVQTIRTLQNAIEKKRLERLRNERLRDQQQIEIDGLKNSRQKHQKTVDDLADKSRNLEHLYEVKNWFTAYKPLKVRADKLAEEMQGNETNIEALKHRKNTVLTGFPDEWGDCELKELPARIQQGITDLKRIKTEREAVYQQTLLQEKLREYADSLTEGNPCPLCGSVHHPAKHDTSFTKATAEKALTLLKTVETRIEETSGLFLIISTLLTEVRGEMANKKRLIQERGDVVKALTEHEDTFRWAEFSIADEKIVAVAIKQESDLQKKLGEARKAVDTLTTDIEKGSILLTKQTADLATIHSDIAGLAGQIQSEVESLKQFMLVDVESWTLVQIEDLRESLDRQYQQTKVVFENAERSKSNGEKEQLGWQKEAQTQTRLLTDTGKELTDLQQLIDDKFSKNALTQEQVEQILGNAPDVESEKKKIADYTDKLGGLRNQVADLEKAVANQPFDPAALASLSGELGQLRTEKDSLSKAFGKAETILKTLQNQWAEKQKHQQKNDDLMLRKQDLDEMEKLFRSQGFVNYVSSVYLKNLCESANDRFFKLTNNQLKLELDDKNNFLVRDYLNGGEVRSVKTLSGGQTFQAALSLALALSDNIQHLTKAKQNLFFLDEGFGTLDKDALQTVFKTLKALRAENRVVGIISHVEELQHEVDNYIRAEVTEEGSKIVRSWEQ